MSVRNDGQLLLLRDGRHAIRVSQFGVDLSVKLVGDRGVGHSSFERLAAICSGTSFILPLTKLNYASMEIKLSSEDGNLETLKPLNHS